MHVHSFKSNFHLKLLIIIQTLRTIFLYIAYLDISLGCEIVLSNQISFKKILLQSSIFNLLIRQQIFVNKQFGCIDMCKCVQHCLLYAYSKLSSKIYLFISLLFVFCVLEQ